MALELQKSFTRIYCFNGTVNFLYIEIVVTRVLNIDRDGWVQRMHVAAPFYQIESPLGAKLTYSHAYKRKRVCTIIVIRWFAVQISWRTSIKSRRRLSLRKAMVSESRAVSCDDWWAIYINTKGNKENKSL